VTPHDGVTNSPIPTIRAPAVGAMRPGLQRRLLVLLTVPLILLALMNIWLDYRLADDTAAQQDQRLQALIPLVADSVIAPASLPGEPPLLMLAPAVEEFINDRPGYAAFSLLDADGKSLLGESWLTAPPPGRDEPQFNSQENRGVTWRIVRQRVPTVAGVLVVSVADGSDPRQQWLRSAFLKVLLPNLALLILAAFAVNWAVRRALKPLLELKEAVERRSPRDLNNIDEDATPEEVRPLVKSLNRLFDLVNDQADAQRRFVADAAHQLRTPLAGLQSQVEAWAAAAERHSASPPGPRSKKALSQADTAQAAITLGVSEVLKLRNATRRTSQLANQLLALSRADARTMHAQPMQTLELKDLCEAILEQHLDAASAKQIDLGQDAQAATVRGHDWLLRELLSNLVDNAVKYTPVGGTITLRCGYQRIAEGLLAGRQLPFLEVEDDGPGVDPAELPHVMERFYRIRGTQGEGNGLGLAIADEIARLHQCQLQLGAGVNGRGLKASLVFPV
jgi:two-component system, OmpR family, sensor histidine kinase TctE